MGLPSEVTSREEGVFAFCGGFGGSVVTEGWRDKRGDTTILLAQEHSTVTLRVGWWGLRYSSLQPTLGPGEEVVLDLGPSCGSFQHAESP